MAGKRKGKGVLITGIVMSIVGIIAIISLIILSALFYPPPEWPEGPPDPAPMVGIIVDLVCSTCCLIGPILLIIGIVLGRKTAKKKKGKKKKGVKKGEE